MPWFRYVATNETDLRRSLTKTLMRRLANDLEGFKQVVGRYPTTEEGLVAAMAMRRKEKASQHPVPPELVAELRAAVPMDSWGKPFIYRSHVEKGSYELYSTGGHPESDSDAIVRLDE